MPTLGDPELSHQPTSTPAGTRPSPSHHLPLPAETWPRSLHFQSIHSKDLVHLGPLPTGAEQRSPYEGRKGRGDDRQTDRQSCC